MRILVTSASGANGNGYGAILGFAPDGELTGPFSSDPRIADPRGLSLDPSGALVYLNSGDNRILALDLRGNVVRDSGRIRGLDPGGAEFGPDGRYYVTMRRQRTILAMPAALDGEGESFLPEGIVPFPRGFGFGPDGWLYLGKRAPLSKPQADDRYREYQDRLDRHPAETAPRADQFRQPHHPLSLLSVCRPSCARFAFRFLDARVVRIVNTVSHCRGSR
jgi:DNA-binding beta-propeller fold protein YncE